MNSTQERSEPVEVTPADTLRAAATYLERHGWTQEAYYFNPIIDNDLWPAACALGAIGMAVHGHEYDCPEEPGLPGWPTFFHAKQALEAHLRATGEFSAEDLARPDQEYTGIGDWNDRHDQTMEAVIAALTAAADEYERTHGGAK